jgi:hypothetical protein
MKKSQVILSLALALSALLPSITHAIIASDCNSLAGEVYNMKTGKCQATGTILPGSTTGTSYTPSGNGGINVSVIKRYSDGIISIINTVIVPVLFAVAFLMFLFGVFKYFILGATEQKSREEGRDFVLWGLIGFVVILSVWGLVSIVATTFGLTVSSGGTPPPPPTL